jgi:excisionase family DNA binding protein
MTENLQENSVQENGLLTRQEAARHLKISTRKLRYEVKAGRVPFVQLGRNVRFIPIDLEAYVQSRRIG